MAGIRDSEIEDERHFWRNLLVIGAVLVVAAGVAFAVFYHGANHAEVEAEGVRTLVVPVHLKYDHIDNTVGEDQTEDFIYVVEVLRLKDRTNAPLFIKDLASSFVTADGATVQGRRVAERDVERLYSVVPQLRPVAESAGKPMYPEQTVPKGGTMEGYVVYEFSAPGSAWEKRQSTSARVDFYKQDSVTMVLPK